MILNHDQFDAALDEASRILDAPPAEGTPTYLRLVGLMQDIAAYRPAILVGSPKIAPDEAERLSKRLDAFEDQLNPHFGPHWHSMIGGDLSPGGKAVD
jgi:antitoxin component HigA of HigAB toxin-antitoxin module